jgi:monoamine oxidase
MAKIRPLSFSLLFAFLLCISATQAKVPAQVDVVIIGAGLSGLTTAYELKKAGLSYHILELAPRTGGRVRTVHYQRPGEPEISADSGMEEYWESNPAVALLRELKLPVRSDFAASSMVLDRKLEPIVSDQDEFFQRVFTEAERQALTNFKKKIEPLVSRILSDKPLPPELLKLKDIAFSKWVEEQKVPRKVAEWIRISVECEAGTSWERFSALDGLEEFHIFLGGPQGKGEMSYRVIGGNEKFTDALSKQVGLEQISLNKRVNRVISQGHEVLVHYLDTATNDSGIIRGSHVVSTIPLFRLFEVQFEPALSAKKREAISTQTWGSYFKAHLFMPRKAERFWTRKETSILPILSDSELGVIYDGNPDQNTPTKIISLLITGDHAEAFNMMPLDEVRARILAGFDRLWPGFSKEVQGVEFYRFHPRAVAGWPVGRSRFDDLAKEVRRPENRVYLSGDFTEGTHSSGAFKSAYRVVSQILKERNKK